MEIISTIEADVPGGVRIATTLDGEAITLFAVVADPDLELLAEIVPAELFESGAQVHANIVGDEDDVQDKLLEVVENMNPGDVAVFLCSSPASLESVLDALDIADDTPLAGDQPGDLPTPHIDRPDQ